MLSRPKQTGVFQEDEEAERPAGTRLPAGFHEFPARPNPAVQPSGRTPATNRIQKELGQKHVGPRSRSSVQQIENSFIESASGAPTRHGQGFPRINGRIAARSRSSPLPSGKRGEEVCIVHVKSVKERATKLLSDEERAPSDRLRTEEMGTFFGGDEIQRRNRPQSTIIPTQRKIAHGEGLGQIPIHFQFHSFPHTRCGQHPTTLPFTPGRTHQRAHP